MSNDAHTIDEMSYLQKYIAVVGGLLAPCVMVYMFIHANAVEVPVAKIDVANNIKPLAQVALAPDRTNYVDMSGEAVFNQACGACHTAGMMNAPKVGDSASWKARIAQGYEALVNNALNGVRAMPARGGNPDLTDLEVARAVTYMANQSGASFASPEPKE